MDIGGDFISVSPLVLLVIQLSHHGSALPELIASATWNSSETSGQQIDMMAL